MRSRVFVMSLMLELIIDVKLIMIVVQIQLLVEIEVAAWLVTVGYGCTVDEKTVFFLY